MIIVRVIRMMISLVIIYDNNRNVNDKGNINNNDYYYHNDNKDNDNVEKSSY